MSLPLRSSPEYAGGKGTRAATSLVKASRDRPRDPRNEDEDAHQTTPNKTDSLQDFPQDLMALEKSSYKLQQIVPGPSLKLKQEKKS